MMKLFHADLAFIDGVVWIIVMFLSGVWTLILTAPIHIGVWANWCNATFLKICCEEQTNSSTSWMGWGGINIQQMFIFGCTILLNVDKIVYFAILNMHDYMVSCVLCFFHFCYQNRPATHQLKNAGLMHIIARANPRFLGALYMQNCDWVVMNELMKHICPCFTPSQITLAESARETLSLPLLVMISTRFLVSRKRFYDIHVTWFDWFLRRKDDGTALQ